MRVLILFGSVSYLRISAVLMFDDPCSCAPHSIIASSTRSARSPSIPHKVKPHDASRSVQNGISRASTPFMQRHELHPVLLVDRDF